MSDLQRLIYDISQALLWPVLIAAVICIAWVLVEAGVLLYELYLRFRYRDMDALEARALRARAAFLEGKPRTAYRNLQENTYSIVVVRFIFELIRNYQTQRLAAKPLKLLQDFEFYTVKRLERTRILVRIGPMLGLMGTLIPLAPALLGLAEGNTQKLADNLTTAFSVTVIGLLIGGLAFVISIVRDRLYAQDISDMEYMLELLEGRGGRLKSGRRRHKDGSWDADPIVVPGVVDEEGSATEQIPLVAGGAEAGAATDGAAGADAVPTGDAIEDAGDDAADDTAALPATLADDAALTFDHPEMDWRREDDPFAALGPAEPAAEAPRPAGDAPQDDDRR
jgi:biopolymer transport protein ExbB/TolQ